MVDIHSHVLYGLDDGAQDRETSVAMLRMAAAYGTSDIVATPHSDLKFPFQPDAIAAQIAELSRFDAIPRLHRGCDFHLSFDNIQDLFEHPFRYTINGHGYLLVEFANQAIPEGIGDVLERMVDRGICPVITHPERNPLLAKDIPRVAEWVKLGCRVQVTGQSFTGRFGRKAALATQEFMRRNLVHFVASDAHDLEHRPPTLKLAFHFVQEEYGDETAHALFYTNPALVLTGQPVSAAPEATPKKRRWFKLW